MSMLLLCLLVCVIGLEAVHIHDDIQQVLQVEADVETQTQVTGFDVTVMKFEGLTPIKSNIYTTSEIPEKDASMGKSLWDGNLVITIDAAKLDSQTKVAPVIETSGKKAKFKYADTVKGLAQATEYTTDGSDKDWQKRALTLQYTKSKIVKMDASSIFFLQILSADAKTKFTYKITVNAVSGLSVVTTDNYDKGVDHKAKYDEKKYKDELDVYTKGIIAASAEDIEKTVNTIDDIGYHEFDYFDQISELEPELEALKKLLQAVTDKDDKKQTEQAIKSIQEMIANLKKQAEEDAKKKLLLLETDQQQQEAISQLHTSLQRLKMHTRLYSQLKMHTQMGLMYNTHADQLLAIRQLIMNCFANGGYGADAAPANPVANAAWQTRILARHDANGQAQGTMNMHWRGVLHFDRVRSWSTNLQMDFHEISDNYLQIVGGGGGTSASGSTFALSENQALIVKSMRDVDVQAFTASRVGYQAHMEGSWDAARSTYASKIMRLMLIVRFEGSVPRVGRPNLDSWWQVMVSGIPGGKGLWTKDAGTGMDCDFKHYRAGHGSRANNLHTRCLAPLATATNVYHNLLPVADRISLFNQFTRDYEFLKAHALIDHSLLVAKLRPTMALLNKITMQDVDDWKIFGYDQTGAVAGPGAPINANPVPLPGAATPWQTWMMTVDFHHTSIIDILMPYAARDTPFYIAERNVIGVNFGISSHFIQDQYRKAWQFATIFFLRGPTDPVYLRSIWLNRLAGGNDINYRHFRANAGVYGAPGPYLAIDTYAPLPAVTLTPARLKKRDVTTGYDIVGIHHHDGEEVWSAPVAKGTLDWNRARPM